MASQTTPPSTVNLDELTILVSTADPDELTILARSFICYNKFTLAKQVRPGAVIEYRCGIFESWMKALERISAMGCSLDEFRDPPTLHAVKSGLSAIHDAVERYIENPPAGELDKYGRGDNLRNIDEALVTWSRSLGPPRDGGDELADLMAGWQPFDEAAELTRMMADSGL